EIFYRYRVSPQFEITPDFQLITRAGGNPGASAVKVIGLRANIAY
ncbi:MAG: carbohydrate porin, partial [Betaproteobacteria bacterium]|nr:carbohydrate porin [Betaproteobacteria bacterium]